MTVRDENVYAASRPQLSRAPTGTVEPSLNVRVPCRIQSFPLGRSYRIARPIVTGLLQLSWIHAPAPCPLVAHSFVESPGYPSMIPSTALTASEPTTCEEACTVACGATLSP